MSNIEHYKGCCTCNSTRVSLNLPKALSTYRARACDCDFCSSHGNPCYLSEPLGTLSIVSQHPLKEVTQGSQQARFLLCPKCDYLVAVTLDTNTGLIGAINANILDKRSDLQRPQTVSPQYLSSAEKLARWRQVWMTVLLENH